MSESIPPRRPLAELREAAASAESAAAEGRLLASLSGDPRRGARALAEQLERRRTKRRRDSRRVSRLFALRRELVREGARFVAGVDEVGVGPLAGPVVAAAVVLPDRVELPGLDDSKQVKRADRERLDAAIRAQALAVSIGEASTREIDRHNILQATLLAMRRAVEGLSRAPDHVLVDARTIPGVPVRQTALIDGDARDGSIAAASIVAKVYRDALMIDLDGRHPGYGLAQHKGYGTREHLRALARLGPSASHRRSFAPVAQHVR